MPISSRAFVQRNVWFLTLGILAIAAIVVTSFYIALATQRQADAVIDLRRVRSAVADLRSQIQDAETGQRGYLLTSDPAYLAPYTTATERIPTQLADIASAAIIYPDMTEPLGRLKSAIASKMEELERTVQLTREGKQAEALAVVHTNAGKTFMDDARSMLDELLGSTDRSLTQTIAEQRASATTLQWVLGLGSLIILGTIGSGAWTVFRYTRELSHAREEIEALNVGLEEKVSERTADLGRANEEIQRFAYIVTHDLRAPLVNIMGFTSELEAGLGPLQALANQTPEAPLDEAGQREAKLAATEDLPEAIGFIRSSTAKMDGLINAILKLSREGRRPLKPERLDLDQLLKASAAAVQHQILDAGGEVTFDIRLRHILSDRISIEQAVGNLFDNAVKYRHKERPLKLAVRVSPYLSNRVVIEVEDNGRGIAAQDHERVFELFRRSGLQDQAGEGIGLAHVRAAIRTMGGDITVSSTLGTGTTFRIVLPRDLEAQMRSMAA